jgi:energy-converting hydrogenase Eha subunit F
MNNHRSHRTAVAIFAVVLAVVLIAALVTTLRGVDTMRVANNEIPPVVTGLSQPHAPLDRAPGRAVQN